SPDEPCAGIGDARQPRIGDERHALAREESRQELVDAFGFVVLVVGDEPRLDAVPLEQAARVSCVLGQDDVGIAQLGGDAQRDVVEVSDRRRAEREHYKASNATRPAPIMPAAEPSSARASRTVWPPGASASRRI